MKTVVYNLATGKENLIDSFDVLEPSIVLTPSLEERVATVEEAVSLIAEVLL